MEPTTPSLDTPPSNNGAPPSNIPQASSEDMMKVLVRQHRVINSLRDQLGSVLVGLAETQATVEELREDLAAAQAELERYQAPVPQPVPGQFITAE